MAVKPFTLHAGIELMCWDNPEFEQSTKVKIEVINLFPGSPSPMRRSIINLKLDNENFKVDIPLRYLANAASEVILSGKVTVIIDVFPDMPHEIRYERDYQGSLKDFPVADNRTLGPIDLLCRFILPAGPGLL